MVFLDLHHIFYLFGRPLDLRSPFHRYDYLSNLFIESSSSLHCIISRFGISLVCNTFLAFAGLVTLASVIVVVVRFSESVFV